jgi:hypothetical protein
MVMRNWYERWIVRCKDCGLEFATKARNARHCESCRMAKVPARDYLRRKRLAFHVTMKP